MNFKQENFAVHRNFADFGHPTVDLRNKLVSTQSTIKLYWREKHTHMLGLIDFMHLNTTR